MATITPVLPHKYKSETGPWRVSIRLTHNRSIKYISTKLHAGPDDVDDNGKLTIDFIVDYLAADLKKYRKLLNDIEDIELYTVDEVRDILTGGDGNINLMPFFKSHIERLVKEGRSNTTRPFKAVYNSLVEYNGAILHSKKLTSKFLKEYEKYLRTPKTIVRKQGQGVDTVHKDTFLTDNGVHNHMSALRTLFNAAKAHFNDEEIGKIRIANNPFSKYEIKRKKKGAPKAKSIDDIRKIRDFSPETSREKFAKDIYMLSIYLCGMNMIDIFNYWGKIKELPERIEYNRSKTKIDRNDEAFISIKIPPEARELIKNITLSYSSEHVANNSVSIGLRSIGKKINIENLTFYTARHSFATIARNDCKMSRESISIALNHVQEESRITDIYLAPDWSIIDEVQDAVIMKINEDLEC